MELLSARDGRRECLGSMVICNDGTSEKPRLGNYEVRTVPKNYNPKMFGLAELPKGSRLTRVVNHARLAKSVWSLVRKALEQMDY